MTVTCYRQIIRLVPVLGPLWSGYRIELSCGHFVHDKRRPQRRGRFCPHCSRERSRPLR